MADIALIRLARTLVGERYVDTAVRTVPRWRSERGVADGAPARCMQFVLSLTSFFHGLALSRSLSNSAETALTTAALSFFPWDAAAASSWK